MPWHRFSWSINSKGVPRWVAWVCRCALSSEVRSQFRRPILRSMPGESSAQNAIQKAPVAVAVVQDHVIGLPELLQPDHDPRIRIDLQDEQLILLVYANVAPSVATHAHGKKHTTACFLEARPERRVNDLLELERHGVVPL